MKGSVPFASFSLEPTQHFCNSSSINDPPRVCGHTRHIEIFRVAKGHNGAEKDN